jgi:hypothetical protein
MPKAKSASKMSRFMTASPLSTGATLLVILSVLANLGMLLGYVLVNHTTEYDTGLYNYTHNKVCADYDQLTSKEQSLYAMFCDK